MELRFFIIKDKERTLKLSSVTISSVTLTISFTKNVSHPILAVSIKSQKQP